MALNKIIELENGVTVNYHRIVSIRKITNVSNIIELASYTSIKKREEEKEATKDFKKMNVFINTEYFNTDYNENFNIKDAYNYLKTLEQFNNAEDC